MASFDVLFELDNRLLGEKVNSPPVEKALPYALQGVYSTEQMQMKSAVGRFPLFWLFDRMSKISDGSDC